MWDKNKCRGLFRMSVNLVTITLLRLFLRFHLRKQSMKRTLLRNTGRALHQVDAEIARGR